MWRKREAREAERRRREHEEEQRRLREQQARAHHQEMLAKDLRHMARSWTASQELRAFLAGVERAVPAVERGERFVAWLDWARAHANDLDPLTAPAKIPKTLEPEESASGEESS